MVMMQNGVAFDRPVSLFIDSGCSTDPQVLEFMKKKCYIVCYSAINLFVQTPVLLKM